jgi:hypothetical protein
MYSPIWLSGVQNKKGLGVEWHLGVQNKKDFGLIPGKRKTWLND